MFFLDAEGSKNENEYKDIINTQAPFHQVSAEVFNGKITSFFNPHKNKKAKRQQYPEECLIQCCFNTDDFILFA